MIFQLEVAFVTGIALSVLAFMLVPIWLNRKDHAPGESQSKCKKHVTDPANDPRLLPRPDESIKVIRLTNSGEFVDRCELTNALYELNWDRERPDGSFGVRRRPGAQKLPKLAILYVHGWKHDASHDDGDLKNFSRMIDDLRVQHEMRKQVVGIFVGWNATAGLPGLTENISFWVKKANADRIAQSAVVTKIVAALGSITRSDPNRADQLIAIGHSFGARILFSAVAQSFIYEAEKAHPSFPGGQYKLVAGPADAVILLNPAFEASRYNAIDIISRDEEAFQGEQPPLMVSISTENDWATKFAFPIGQWLAAARSRRELTTLGNYGPFTTHSLTPSPSERENDDSATMEQFEAVGLRLSRLTDSSAPRVVHAHNPFFVARTTRDVIDGHNGIWADDFRLWLSKFIGALEIRHERKAMQSHEMTQAPFGQSS